MGEMKRLSELVIGLRSGTVNIAIIKDALIENEEMLVNNGIDELAQDLQHLAEKELLIRQLQEKEFHYCNATDRDINKRDDDRIVEMKLIRTDQDVRFLCSNDALNRASPLQLNKLQSDLIEEHQHNATLRLFYADFSYCLYELPHMTILPLNANLKQRHVCRMKTPSALTQLQPPVPLHGEVKMNRSTNDTVHDSISPSSLPMNDTINILLLGETGVGKSTFINAFANYLTFSSLQKAHLNKPVVIIPVSFLLTIGDNFEERTVKFGDADRSNNEDFDHPGQSVTQRCKSYIFTLNHHDGKKLRIIDTPGFGDTRGLDQDDLNMEHILQYINNLSHLNAICFLLKPNASRLNMFFRTCLTQLFSLLAPTARHNVIFCFTNARSTFYTPGDTAPLLKTLLSSLSMGDIPFRKENTFCFDSESFRYLVALQNDIEFSVEDKREYATSWSTSVKESNRLIDHIDGNLVRYDVRKGMQSMKHAQFEIIHMIRPILETIRNTLRNLILHRMHSSNVFIKLHPKPVLRQVAICFRCERQSVQLAHFQITLDQPHEFYKKCATCSCATTDHKAIDYVLEYKTRNNPSTYQTNEMNDILHRLSNAAAKFSYFLMYGARCTEDDQFITGLMRMIDEEEDICHGKGSYPMNLQLIEELKQVYHEYQQRINELGAKQDSKTLQTIYQHIETISSYFEMREQMIAVKQSHNAIMKEHEVVV